MQRPNFQMIEDLPEKNYMRYVSQYKLDDMVTYIYVQFEAILKGTFIHIHYSDGQIEDIKLRGHSSEGNENEAIESVLFFEFDKSRRAILHVYLVVCLLCSKIGQGVRTTGGVYGSNAVNIENYATSSRIGKNAN